MTLICRSRSQRPTEARASAEELLTVPGQRYRKAWSPHSPLRLPTWARWLLLLSAQQPTLGRGQGFSAEEAGRHSLVLEAMVEAPQPGPASIVSMNGSSWAQAQTELEHLRSEGAASDDVVLLQETRFPSDRAAESAWGWCARNGLQAALGPCRSTGDTAQEVSSGVGILTADFRGVAPISQEWGDHSSRVIARRIAFGDMVIVVVSLYLVHSCGVAKANLDILGQLQEFVNGLSEPFIIG